MRLLTVTRVTHVTQFLVSRYKERYRKESKNRVTPVTSVTALVAQGPFPDAPVHRLSELQHSAFEHHLGQCQYPIDGLNRLTIDAVFLVVRVFKLSC